MAIDASIPKLPSLGEAPWYVKRQAFDTKISALAKDAHARLGILDTLGGITPGNTSDASMTGVIRNPDSLFSTELSAVIDETTELAFAPIEGSPVFVDGWQILGLSGENLYAASGLGISRLNGASWVAVNSLPAGPPPRRIHPLGNGEIIINRDTELWKSTGWSINPATATFRKVHEIPAAHIGKTRFHQGWGVSVFGDKVLATEYGTHGTSRYGWYSKNSGDTFATVFDYHDWPNGNQAGAGGAHMHGAGINPYDGTLFLVGGDSAPSAIFWANMTAPTVWAPIPNQPFMGNGAKVLPTPITATAWGMVLTSDSDPNGVWVIPHSATRNYKVEFALTRYTGLPNNQVVGQHVHVDDKQVAWCWFNRLSTPDAPVASFLAAGSSADRMAIIWEDTKGVTTADGYLVFPHGDHVYVSFAAARYMKLPRPKHGSPRPKTPDDNGFLMGGTALTDGQAVAAGIASEASGVRSAAFGGSSSATGSGSVALGHKATATGQGGVAIGGGNGVAGSEAISTGPSAMALGAYSRATGEAVAIGAAAEAPMANALAIGSAAKATGASGVAVGSGSTASGTNAVAVGRLANAAGASSVAIGYGSTASVTSGTALGYAASVTATRGVAVGRDSVAGHNDSVALGDKSSTTGTSQVAIGPRSMLFTARAGDPATPPTGAGELFFKIVSGKGGWYGKLPSGAVVGPILVEP